jgi:hypothetical protein
LRAWRVEPNHGRSLAARYATPWDQDAGEAYTSPDEARNILRAWQRSGTVVRDPRPALYVYEQSGPRGSVRGLLGAVRLDSTLLPYQETIPTRVEGVTQLMRVGEMNLDPVLLGYPGDGRTAARLDEAARRTPLTEILATDGQAHRLWPITAPDAHRDIAAELGTRAALIADGHHRHAAARLAVFAYERYLMTHQALPDAVRLCRPHGGVGQHRDAAAAAPCVQGLDAAARGVIERHAAVSSERDPFLSRARCLDSGDGPGAGEAPGSQPVRLQTERRGLWT